MPGVIALVGLIASFATFSVALTAESVVEQAKREGDVVLEGLASKQTACCGKFKGVFSRNPQHDLGALSISPRPLKQLPLINHQTIFGNANARPVCAVPATALRGGRQVPRIGRLARGFLEIHRLS